MSVWTNMAKQLGQIHTVNFSADNLGASDKYLCDLSKELTQQLGHMVRNSNSMKLVGLDMVATEYGGTGSASVSGFIRYYSPSKGRVAAYKNAYSAVKRGMKLNGINVVGNKLYDFRVSLQDRKIYTNSDDFVNQAAIGGQDGLGEISLGDEDLSPDNYSAFAVYNLDRQPVSTQSDTPTFSTGYTIATPSGEISDFVSNEGFYWDGMSNVASQQMETIPFQLSWTPTTDDTAFTFQWRPDPALYISLMCGQFDVVIDEIDSQGNPISIDIAAHVAGWKPVLGGKKRGKKSRSKRRRK